MNTVRVIIKSVSDTQTLTLFLLVPEECEILCSHVPVHLLRADKEGTRKLPGMLYLVFMHSFTNFPCRLVSHLHKNTVL